MFHGSMVALVTPMYADGVVDEDSLAGLIEFHIAAGTDAIVAIGTTGESATLDEEEHCATMARTVEFVAGRIPVEFDRRQAREGRGQLDGLGQVFHLDILEDVRERTCF